MSMKIYLITASQEGDDALPPEVSWAGSQTEAAAARKNLNAAGFRRTEIQTHDVEVPTSKGPLLEFLNNLSSGPTVLVATQKLRGK